MLPVCYWKVLKFLKKLIKRIITHCSMIYALQTLNVKFYFLMICQGCEILYNWCTALWFDSILCGCWHLWYNIYIYERGIERVWEMRRGGEQWKTNRQMTSERNRQIIDSVRVKEFDRYKKDERGVRIENKVLEGWTKKTVTLNKYTTSLKSQ